MESHVCEKCNTKYCDWRNLVFHLETAHNTSVQQGPVVWTHNYTDFPLTEANVVIPGTQ